MIFELETAIKTKLEATNKFVNVYDTHTLKSDWYPYCTFELSSFDWKYLDSCTNERDFIFNLVMLHTINADFTRDTAKDILYRALEDVIERFDGDMDLSESTIVRGKVLTWEMGVLVEWEWQTLVLNVNISLTVVTTAQQ